MFINHDLETTPLQVFTNTELKRSDFVSMKFESGMYFRVEFCCTRFLTDLCGYPPFPPHLPEEVHKIWTISRTKEALTVLCNGVEVLNLVYAEVDKGCSMRWSKSSTKIMFRNDDLSSDYMKTLSPGKYESRYI